jgi:hypothetical protein
MNLWHHLCEQPAAGGDRGSNLVRSLGETIEVRQRPLRFHAFAQAMCLMVLCLQCNPAAHALDKDLERYRDLKPIAFFGAISVSVHNTDAKGDESQPDFSSEDLAQYLRLQAENYFPDVPYRSMDAAAQPDPGNDSSMGRLFCRIWVDSRNIPAVFQVRCQISTPTRLNIIDDVSFGYGPKEMAPSIVREQINQILKGFASIFLRIRNES